MSDLTDEEKLFLAKFRDTKAKAAQGFADLGDTDTAPTVGVGNVQVDKTVLDNLRAGFQKAARGEGFVIMPNMANFRANRIIELANLGLTPGKIMSGEYEVKDEEVKEN